MAETPTKTTHLEEMEKSLYPLLRIDALWHRQGRSLESCEFP